MKFVTSFHFGILWTYISELFETKLRVFAIGFNLTLGLVFQALGSFTVVIANRVGVHPLSLPLIGIIGSLIASIYAPETKGQTLKN